MDDDAWLRQHVRVLFEMDERGRMNRLNEPDPDGDAPRVFLARSRASTLIAFRADVPDPIASDLATVVSGLAPWNGRRADTETVDPLRRAVRAWLGEAEESHGPAFRFPASAHPDMGDEAILIDEASGQLLDASFPYTRTVLGGRSPVAAIVREGAVVSACYSARRRATAAEAGVHTVEPYRGRGLAVVVVAAWAAAAQGAGMTPLYSTSWDNAASLRVAAKLGLDAYADTVSFE